MSTEDTEHRLAREVAQACDAWLTDPLDTGVYQRLVASTLRWRHYTRPTLDEAGPAPDQEPRASTADEARPRRVGDLLAAPSPQEALARLNAAAPGAQAPGAAVDQGDRAPGQ